MQVGGWRWWWVAVLVQVGEVVLLVQVGEVVAHWPTGGAGG